jgi:hypothetical protein
MKRLTQALVAAIPLLVGGLASAQLAPGQDILKPEQAFRYAVTATGDELLVRWTIEPEHYL